jgi:hypothetical protein
MCEPYRELIARWLDDGRTATSIFQELVEKHGFAASCRCRVACAIRIVRARSSLQSAHTQKALLNKLVGQFWNRGLGQFWNGGITRPASEGTSAPRNGRRAFLQAWQAVHHGDR